MSAKSLVTTKTFFELFIVCLMLFHFPVLEYHHRFFISEGE